jgi:hypothetical protein
LPLGWERHGRTSDHPLTSKVGRLWSGLSGRSKCQLKVSLDS